MSSGIKLGIVIPCYNEEAVLPESIKRIVALIGRLTSLGKISNHSKMVFVDDGSSDRTWAIIEEAAERNPHVAGIKLSRNCGHQNALLAGLFTTEGDALVSLDADLQDDIEAIEAMVDKFLGGADVVYGVRKQRTTDTWFKRRTAHLFYRLISRLGAESIYNHADYRLMSRRAIEALKQFREVNLYLRGIVPLIGFPPAIVYYDRANRFAGESKYSIHEMIGLALNGITSFSITPLRMITYTGFIIFLGSLGVTAWAFWVRLFTDEAVPGWASLVLPMYFLGGIQLFCIGMLGEYLGKTYAEIKGRPRYFIEKTVSGAHGDGESAPSQFAEAFQD